MTRDELKLGIYEKALPPGSDWYRKLSTARRLGFGFVEMSIDESDNRLSRLKWSRAERAEFVSAVHQTGCRVPSICFSGHRRFPLGSHDPAVRSTAAEMMREAVELADDLGVRVIQLAGYDVYYETSDSETRKWFLEGLHEALSHAAAYQVMLAMEIMDTPYINSISSFMELRRQLPSPWFTVYPDIGNLTAWGNDVSREVDLGFSLITAIHLKDTLKVTAEHPGTFRDVPFGEGCVDFDHFFALLARLGYRGPFVIEMWSEKSPDPEAQIVRARDWMLDRMAGAGFLSIGADR
jgi:L-ribulose-5-phosphate 3-epimerase